ncbi:MAG: heparinase II/III domain-containing protein [Thermoguttaceae bacterium]
MKSRDYLLTLLLVSVSCMATAAGPRVLFDGSQVAELRERVARPEHTAVWARIVEDAEAYCDPQSARYVDPADPYALPKKSPYMDQGRHDALLVHRVGRSLTDRMEAIGIVYQLTGRKELGRHGAKLLLATVERYPITHPTISKGFAGGRGDVMRGLAMGYDLLSDQLTEAERGVVAGACADYLDFFVKEFNDPKSWWYGVHNYNGVNGGSAGCLALALGDAFPDRSAGWVAECVKIIDRWLSTGFDEEGACLEGVGYSSYGLSNTVVFAHALARADKGDLFAHPTFGRLAEYYALSLLPGEKVFDARNDSSYSGLDVSALGLAAGMKSGLYRWLWETTGTEKNFERTVWTDDVTPVDPAAAGVPAARHFRGRGLCIWRTGWTDRDVMFSIEAGPYYPVTHNQGDKGHFTLYGLGHRWAVDTGYANEHEPRGRGQTVGHSCILIDGKGQALSGAGLGTNGSIVRYENNGRYGYALADCTEAYNRNNKGQAGAGARQARRHALFVYPRAGAPAYAVLADDIAKDDAAHDFTWQMIYAEKTAVTIEGGRATLVPEKTAGREVDAARLVVHVDSASGAVLTTDVFEPEDYHGPAAFPRLRATVRAVEPRFLAVLLPLAGEVEEPEVRFESAGEKRLLRVAWAGHTDVFEWPAGDGAPEWVE